MGILPNGEYTNIPEQWFPLLDFYIPGIKNWYEVSNYGKIYNKYTGNTLPGIYHENNYNAISISFMDGTRRNFEVHRIIAMVFVYNADLDYSKDVNHIDGIKGHNWAWNLEWTTHKENLDHCINTGLMPLGDQRKNSSFTNNQIEQICLLISQGKTNSEIGQIMNLQNGNVSKLIQNIKNGHCWKHISQKYNMDNCYKRSVFSDDEIHKICKYFEDNGKVGYKEILNFMGFDVSIMNEKELSNYNSCICSLRNKKLYKQICNQYNY